MKSFFTKLGTLLLCGVAVAMVGCTDFSEDIQAGDAANSQLIADLTAATDVKVENLQKAIDALSAQVAADRTTLQELQNVHNTFATSVQGQIDGLTANFNKVNNDLSAAQTAINAQIAALQKADTDNKAALEAAIATAKSEASAAIAQLQTALGNQKTELEAEIAAVQEEIADAKAELEAVIAEKAGKEYVDEELGKVDAKANELFNTIQSLSEYLGTLQAQVLELKNTLDSLALYLPTVEAKIADNTAKATELQNTLLSLSDHLAEREALVNAQLKELQNTLLSLDVYMETLEASIDARFAEILNTIESLAIHLVEVEAQIALNTESAAAANAKAEELYNTLLSLSYDYNEEKASNAAKFAEVLATFESLSIHLAQKEAEHEAGIADNSAKIAELKNELVSLSKYLEEANYDGKFAEIQNTLLSLSEHLAAEEAANLAKFAEILNTFESLSQHLSEKEANVDAKLAELFMTLQSLSPVIENLDAKILEVKNTVESLGAVVMDSLAVHNAKIYEMNNTLVSLSLFLEEANLIVRVAALEDDLKAHLAAYEVFQAATVEDLATLFARTEELFGQLEALSPEFSAVKAQVAELKNELLSLSEHLGEREANVDGKLAELFATFQSLAPVIETMQAQILENNSALVSLSPVIETMQAQILENFNTLQSLSPKIEELEEKDAQLEAMVWEVKNELVALSEYLPTMQAQILENKGTLDSLSEYLPELKAELEEKIGSVDAKANELNGQLTALAQQLPVMFAEVNAAIEAVADRVSANEEKISDLQEQTAELQNAVEALQNAHSMLTEQLQNKLTNVDNAIEALQESTGDNAAAIKALQDAHALLEYNLQNKLTNLDNTIEALTEAIEKNEAAIAKNGASIEANSKLIAKNAEDIVAANVVIAELQAEFQVFVSNVNYALTNLNSATEANRNEIEGLLDNVADLQAELAEAQAGLLAAIGRIDALEDAVEALQYAHSVLTEQLQNKLTNVDNTLAALQEADEALAAELKKAVKDLYTANQNVLDNLSERLANHTDKLFKLIDALNTNVEKLLNRIQSVVYVPTHSDGKARVQYAVVGTAKPQVIQSNKNSIEYQVYPESAAKEIADAYNNGDENFSISFLAKSVYLTKAATEYITVEEVMGNAKNGVLTIHYSTNFPANFFPVGKDATKSYSAALVIENTANDEKFSTEYTNFVAGDYANYTLGLIYKANYYRYKGEVVEYDIEYTDDNVYPVLDQIVPIFYGNAGMSYTVSEFEYAYGSAPEVTVEMSAEPKDTKTFVTNFEADALTVQLGEEVSLVNVGEELDVTLTYTAGGDSVSANANVEVVGVKVNYAVENALTATWEYLKDAASDVTHATHRTFLVPVADVKTDNPIANTSLKDILANEGSIVITSSDADVDYETIVLSANSENMTVEFNNFEWDATYNVVATYDLNYAKVKIEFTINTVDRNRKAIDIVLGSTTLDYVKDLVVAPNTYKYDLAPVIAKLVEDGNLDANYAEDIFVKHMVEVNNYCKFDAADLNNALTSTATPTSNDIMFDFQNQQYTFRYNSNKLEAVHSALVFNATFTTWYGQVVTIKHNIAFEFPVYDFVHTTYYVKNENGNYYSQVMGVYEDGTEEKPVNTTALMSFTTDKVDMMRAFNVVDAEGNLVDKLEEHGLVVDFDIEGAHGAGIVMSNENVISYNDKDAYVDVIGKIYLVNENGTKVEIPTSFATTYAGYIVKKYDPIGELHATNFEQKIENKIKYHIPILKHFSLKDSRNFVEMYDLVDANGNWVVGNGQNGFAEGYTPCNVYGLKTDYAAVTVPVGFADIISFNKDTGILTFDNSNNMAIVEDIVIDITFIINYTWGSRQATVQCTFPKNI